MGSLEILPCASMVLLSSVINGCVIPYGTIDADFIF